MLPVNEASNKFKCLEKYQIAPQKNISKFHSRITNDNEININLIMVTCPKTICIHLVRFLHFKHK